jgi:hypothetical protein
MQAMNGLHAMLKALLGAFNRTTLLPHEQLCLDGWRASLPEAAREILDKQLAAVRLVQRQAGGAKVCFYYRNDVPFPLFSADQPDLLAAVVVLQKPQGTEAQTMRVKVYVHRGRFFSLEFPKRPERYVVQHGMALQELQVARVEIHHVLTP